MCPKALSWGLPKGPASHPAFSASKSVLEETLHFHPLPGWRALRKVRVDAWALEQPTAALLASDGGQTRAPPHPQTPVLQPLLPAKSSGPLMYLLHIDFNWAPPGGATAVSLPSILSSQQSFEIGRVGSAQGA